MKKEKRTARKIISLSQIYLMISMTIAFSILLGWQMPVVSAAYTIEKGGYIWENGVKTSYAVQSGKVYTYDRFSGTLNQNYIGTYGANGQITINSNALASNPSLSALNGKTIKTFDTSAKAKLSTLPTTGGSPGAKAEESPKIPMAPPPASGKTPTYTWNSNKFFNEWGGLETNGKDKNGNTIYTNPATGDVYRVTGNPADNPYVGNVNDDSNLVKNILSGATVAPAAAAGAAQKNTRMPSFDVGGGKTMSADGTVNLGENKGFETIIANDQLTPNGIKYAKLAGYVNPQVKDGLIVDMNKDGSFTFDGNKYDENWGWTGSAARPESNYYKGSVFGIPVEGMFLGHLADGVTWGIGVAGGIEMIGTFFGMDKNIIHPVAAAAGVGLFVGQGAYGAIKQFSKDKNGFLYKNAAAISFGVGLAAAAITFLMMYKKTTQKVVKFECLPWEAPLGGSKCEQCNKDPFRPCSEYRCKALGQACELLNAGSTKETCAWVGRNDVKSPVITLWDAALSPNGLKYAPDNVVRPPMIGFKIQKDGKCLPAFTALQFGIKTDEPAQCKIDMNHTDNLDQMQYYFGGSNYFEYNHTEVFNLPGPEMLQNVSAPILRNDGSFAYYIRCMDANGNYNRDEFVVSFCVDKGPDTTPPVINQFSITSGSAVQYQIDNVTIEAYTNEPAQCKWSTSSKSYKDMENVMSCPGRITQLNSDVLYTCSGRVSGIKDRQDNTFYFKCKDSAGNEMVQSKELVLRGSQPLTITEVGPNGTISGSTNAVATDLIVKTENGADEGKAQCLFSTTGARDSYIAMFETDSYSHKQPLSLGTGSYDYFFRCVDSGGNLAENKTSFNIKVDKSAPTITRIYKQDGLKIVTDEDAECSYSLTSCNFKFEDGTGMIYANLDKKDSLFAEWNPSVKYFIKCKDQYGNQPGSAECSAEVSATDIASEDTTTTSFF